MQHFESVSRMLRAGDRENPVMCFNERTLKNQAKRFVSHFPGTTLYAVKANPHPVIIKWALKAGISHFDTASIAEIELVKSLDAHANCSFNHPVKSRQAITRAYHEFGVRDFVVDHQDELDKVLALTGPGITIQVRLSHPNPDVIVDLNTKFGTAEAGAIKLVRRVADAGAAPALSFHVGYQAPNCNAHDRTIALAATVAAASPVPIAYLNTGGGFPSVVTPKDRVLEDYFAGIASAVARHDIFKGIALRCEPGCSLAYLSAAVAARVLLRKPAAVYLNDGIYGAMNELAHSKAVPPVTVYCAGGHVRSGAPVAMTLFGPTCDSLDVLPVPFALPQDTREGDWLCIEQLGAYTNALNTGFNGLGTLDYVTVDRF